MTEPNGTFTLGKDNSIEVPIDGKSTRFVLESDLLAVKGGAEKKEKEWVTKEQTYTTQVSEVTKLRDEAHQNFLKAQAEKEQLVTKYKDYDTHVARVGELTKEVETHKTSLKKHEEELVKRMKANLTSLGAKEESLKDKTLDQLRSLEEAASIFGNPSKKGANYDGGDGGGGSTAETPHERAKRIVEAQERRQGKDIKVSAPAK